MACDLLLTGIVDTPVQVVGSVQSPVLVVAPVQDSGTAEGHVQSTLICSEVSKVSELQGRCIRE